MDMPMRDLSSDTILTIYPLAGVSEAQLKKLCLVLWDWNLCIGCKNGQPCLLNRCPWRRSSKLRSFFRFYENTTAFYIPDPITSRSRSALREHEDLFNIIEKLKDNQTVSRSILTADYFAQRGREFQPAMADQNQAFNIAMTIMTTICCSTDNQLSHQFGHGSQPVVWHSTESYQDFINGAFCLGDEPRSNDGVEYCPDFYRLKAVKLKKFAHLKFEGTNNLSHHLRLDQATSTVQIYHNTSILKEHLRASQLIDTSLQASPIREIIPRQLVLETLDSLQRILFPFEDPGSYSCLRSLIYWQQFDPDCLELNSSECRQVNEWEVTYKYWGPRLRDLLNELDNPRPRGSQEWWDKKSKQRHIMIVTTAAFILAGLSLFIASLQVWISYEQWQHPVPGGASV